MKVSKLVGSVFAGLAALVLIAGCAPATKPAEEESASSVAYALTQTPGDAVWPNLKVGVNAASGKTVSHLTFTYAVNANTLLSETQFGYNLGYNGGWTPDQDDPAAANTWYTTTDVASLTWRSDNADDYAAFSGAADQGANLTIWYTGTASTSVYLKQINITYTDDSTEVITFTTDEETPVHIVATDGTTDVAFDDRLWASNYAGETNLDSQLTQGAATVAF